MRPGKYRVLRPFCLTLCRSNGGLNAATRVEEAYCQPGEEFEIGETVNGYFFAGGTTADDAQFLRAELGLEKEVNVERLGN